MNRLPALALLALALTAHAEPPKAKFKLGKDTTFITEPLDADGYLDYETALNERLRGKTTPETNAAVLLWQAIGPKAGGRERHADYWKWLGAKPPEKGEYFVPAPTELEFHKDESRLSYSPWTAKAYPAFADWLAKNEAALAMVVRATKRPDYYNPLVSRTKAGARGLLIGASLDNIQSARRVATALAERAMLKTGEGDFDAAWQDLLTLHRLGRLMGRGGSAIELLVAIAVDAIAVRADLAFLDRAKPDAEHAMQYLAALQKLPPMPGAAEKFDGNERFMFLDAVQHARRTGMAGLERITQDGDPNPNGKLDDDEEKALALLDWPLIFRTGGRRYDEIVAAFKLKVYAERRDALAAVEGDVEKLRRKLSRDPTGVGLSERTGILLIGTMMPAAGKIHVAAARAEQATRNLHLTFALAAYRADAGVYPAKLADLAPKYLATVPNDLFTDNPLVYKRSDNGYLLYSVGANGKDDGGATFSDDPKGDDVVVRMPPAK